MKEISARTNGLFIATALAMLGLIIGNYKTLFSAEVGENSLVWAISLMDGRAAALLGVLAGYAVMIYGENESYIADLAPVRRKRRRLVALGLTLFVTGLCLFPLWHDEFLHPLGLAMMLCSWTITQSSRVIWLLIFGIMLSALLFLVLGYNYHDGWNALNNTAPAYEDILTWRGMSRQLFFYGYYPFFPWAAFFLMGIWLARQSSTNETERNRLIIWAGMIGICAGAMSSFADKFFDGKTVFVGKEEITTYFQASPNPPTMIFLAAAGGLAIVFIMFSTVAATKFGNKKWLLPIIYFGQMPFTVYILHILAGLFLPNWLDLPHLVSVQVMVGYALIFFVSICLFAYFWRKNFAQGPAEWIVLKGLGVLKQLGIPTGE